MGDSVAQVSYGTYCEWGLVPVKEALPVPACAPEIVALLTSGMTASIGELDKSDLLILLLMV